MTRIKRAITIAAGLLLVASVATAQQVNNGNQTGFPPFGSFHGSSFDQIALQNGNLHFEIPVISVPQRGGHPSVYRFVYDTPSYVLEQFSPDGGQTVYWIVDSTAEPSSLRLESPRHWSVNYDVQNMHCSWYHATLGQWIPVDYSVYTNWTVTDSSGTKHPFAARYENYPSGTPMCTQGDVPKGNQLTSVAIDGTGVLLQIASSWPLSYVAYAKDGTRVFDGIDTNGNIFTEIVDTLNRQNIVRTDYTGYSIWTVKNSAAGTQQFRMDFTNLGTGQTSFCGTRLPSDTLPCYEKSITAYFPTKLTLPNGKFYQFSWTTGGDLTSITLPTGGTITYTYVSQSYDASVPHSIYHKRNARRQVISRTVSDGQTSQQWTYTAPTEPYQEGIGSMVVRDPLGNEEVHVYDQIGGSTYEFEVRTYEGLSTSGTLLRKITKEYASEYGPTKGETTNDGLMNIRLTAEREYLDGNLVSLTTTDYETFSQTFLGDPYTATRLNVVAKGESAYGTGGAGSSGRTTTYAYLHTGNNNYLNRNITDRVTTTTVSDASGVVAQSTNVYDVYNYAEFSGIVASNAVQHDSSYNTSFIYRGNVTATQRWRNTDGAWLETRHQFDDAGNIVKSRDPGGHITTFDYTDNWGNASCAPAGQGKAYLKSTTNALNQTTTFTYNSCTGSTASATDPNGQVTTFSYDAYDRSDITNLPGGGQVDNDYDDTARIVTTKTKRTSSAFVVKRAYYDVLGRVWRSELCEDGSTSCTQSINTYTEFDALSRVSRVTNPTRCQSSVFITTCAGEATFGLSKTMYDALSRVTRVIPPDGNEGADSNVIKSSYSGIATTVTDQAGKQRRSYTNTLGQLIQVDEPGGEGSGLPGIGSATVSGTLQGTGGSATPGTGSATVSGSEQSVPGASAAPGTGSVNITGSEQSYTEEVYVGDECTHWEYPIDDSPYCTQWQPVYQNVTYWDSGGVSVTVNGSTKSVAYGQGSTASTIAAALASAINGDSNYAVSASVNGAAVSLTAKTSGASTNYSLSSTSWTNDSAHFVGPSFSATRSGPTLTGGANAAPTVYDSGSIWVTVNGSTKTVTYGQGSTSTSAATALRDAINGDGTYPVSASLSGTTVNLTARSTGASTNYSLAGGSSTSQPGSFSQPSFTVSVSGSTLTGGANDSPFDAGTVSVIVNNAPGGQFTAQVNYGQGSTSSSVASSLASALNVTNSPVTASANGSVVSITAKVIGTSSNYTLSSNSSSTVYPSPSFTAATSGLSGGADYTPGTLATPAVTVYTYNGLDNLLSVVQSSSRQRTFTYNSLSQLITANNPESGTINYTYDSDGNLLTKVSPAPNQTNPAVTVTTTFTYDVLHRLKQKSYSDATPLVKYSYDGVTYSGCASALSTAYSVGRRTAMCDGAGQESWSYDVVGRVLTDRRTTNSVTKDFSYTYNVDSSTATLVYPSGRTITYGYDNAGRATSGVDAANSINYATAATYGPSGALASMQNGASIVSTFFYNSRLQPCRISVKNSGLAPTSCTDTTSGNVLDFTYAFNLGTANNGNVASIANNRAPGRSQSFTYDELNRISTAQSTATSGNDCWGLLFGYDIWANLLSASTTKCAPPNLNVGVNTKNQMSGSCYDSAGNLILNVTCPQPLGVLTYSYDAENRMTQSVVGGVTTTYSYDGDGKRVKKGTVKLYWYGLGADPMEETNASGTASADFIFFGGKRTARLDLPGAAVHYYFANHLGSANVVTSSTGTIQDESDFYPFGGERVIIDTDPNAYKFTGKERDTESNLDFFIARYYSSQYGRFISSDWSAVPISVPYADFNDPQTFNLYGYIRNNPLSHADDDGHCCDWLKAKWESFKAWMNTSPQIIVEQQEMLEKAAAKDGMSKQEFREFQVNLGAGLAMMGGVQASFATNFLESQPATPKSSQAPKPNEGESVPELVIDGNKYPESAQHAADAQAEGKPSVVTWDPKGAAARRAAAMNGNPTVPGMDRDEYPPASTQQGGAGASVRPISPSDNRGAGASMGQQAKGVPSGTKVKIVPENVPKPPGT